MSKSYADLKPESCKTCPLYENPGPVWGTGPKDADMMLVGEAPGEDEATALKPFVGGPGRVLNALLAHSGINREKTFVTNTVKCRPTARGASGRIVNRQPTETEIRHCAKFLLGEIEEVKPNVIVALGNIPLATLTKYKKGVLTMRSVPLEGPLRRERAEGEPERYKIVSTLHPTAVMRSQDYWPAVVFDLARAHVESRDPHIRRRQWKNIIHAKMSEHGEYLERRIRETGRYFHDIETTGLDPKDSAIRCTGLSADADEIFVFDNTTDFIEFMRKLHADPTLMTVGQNSEGFDIPYQEAKGFVFNGPTYDTMLGWHLLNSSLPKDLGFIGATVTDEVYWKDDTMYRSGEDALQRGCGIDVHATARAFEEQMKELKALKQESLYFDHIMPLQPVLRRMTQRGLKKNQKLKVAWHHTLTKKADEYEARLKKGLGDASFDLNSPKQLMDLLYRRMGLPVQYKQTPAGLRPTVDADALDTLAQISNNPILRLIRTIRTLRKWDATFVMCPEDEKGFVHGKFSSAKAANGRLNCTEPNMQNFPWDMRVIMEPDNDDMVLIARDWSQIEWRVAMALSGDKAGLEALAAGRDAHIDAYSKAFIKPYDEVTKDERDVAKAVNYGLLYGRGAESISQGRAGHAEDRIPIDHVREYMKNFLATFTGYRQFRDMIDRKVRRDHYAETAWGRRRYWYTAANMPEAYNFPISGTAAHMMYCALIECEAQLPKGATLRLSIHDEIVVCSPKDQKTLQQAIDCTKDVMERAFTQVMEASLYPDILRQYYPNGWYCPTDVHIGTNWAMCKGKPQTLEAERELIKTLGVKVR